MESAPAAARASIAAFAPNCLLARRLVERGVRFVNLYHASWDHHSDLDCELGFNCGMADQPIAALLKDLKQRGLLDDDAGALAQRVRPHAAGREPPRLPGVQRPRPSSLRLSVWMAGGGIKGGQVIGKTDEHRLERRRRPRPRQRLPRHHPAPVRPRPPEAHVPLPGPRFPPDRRRGQCRHEVSRLAVAKSLQTSALRAMPTEDRMAKSKTSAKIRFSTTLLRPVATGKDVAWTFLVLPKEASAKLPSRGMASVEGTFNGTAFEATLAPDGEGGHWLKVDQKLREAAGAEVGDKVSLEIAPVGKEPEPKAPADWRKALAAAHPKARAAWSDITPVVR